MVTGELRIINKISLYHLNLPLINKYITSFGEIDSKHTIIIKVEDGKYVGFGESAALNIPYYNHETIDTCMYMLEKFLAPLVLESEVEDIEYINLLFKRIKGHNIAKSGLEMALWDIKARKNNNSLAQELGGATKKIGVGESVGIKSSIKEVLQEVEERLSSGFQRIKLKIKPGWDLDVVKLVRKEFGDIPLMVDANSSYSLHDLLILKKLDLFNLMMIEQPLDSCDLWDHAKVQNVLQTPICLDESIKNVNDARHAIEMGSCKIINIKPGRVGGMLESKKIHDLCADHGIPVWCGGMLETGIGKTFCIALASLSNFTFPADISPSSFFFKTDILKETYQVDTEGFIAVNNGIGIGVQINDEFLDDHIVQCVDLIK